ncbi:DUF948 domain-containing protein [Rothia sp. ZJ932]|nr:DUF948 domain-containing protein [Rothia sp. ZJ932]
MRFIVSAPEAAVIVLAFISVALTVALAIPLWKLGKLFDELTHTVKDLNANTTPLIDEVTRTVATTNSQLEKVDGITSNVSDASANVSALSSLVASTVGQPLIKVASFSYGLRKAVKGDDAGSNPTATGSTAAGASARPTGESAGFTQAPGQGGSI